jgi:orotate phosphoribosyltransferase
MNRDELESVGLSLEDERELVLRLLKKHSFERKIVKLASGKTSDFFIDCKQTVLLAEAQMPIAFLFTEAIDEMREVNEIKDVKAVAGVELGGCPLATLVSTLSTFTFEDMDVPVVDALYVRKAAKDHGSKRLIEGGSHLPKGTKVILLEDVVTTGGSSLRALTTLVDEGFDVVGIIALVDRLEGARETFKAMKIPFLSIFTRNDFIPPNESMS